MVSVFISYTRRDAAIAVRVSEALKADNLDVWIERDEIAAGEGWQRAVTGPIREADSVLLLLSLASINSAWVTREYHYALESKTPLFVALVDAVPPDQIPRDLEAIHYVDLTDHFDANIARLVQLIKTQGSVSGARRLRQMAVETELPDSVTLHSTFDKQDVDKLVEEIQESLNSGVRNIKVVKSDDE